MNYSIASWDSEQAARNLLAQFSIEVLPRDAQKFTNFAEHLPQGARVYVAYTSGSTREIVDAVEKLHQQGMRPVPHLPARRFTGPAELEGFLSDLTSRAGIRQVLLIAGDLPTPAGSFTSSLDVLKTGLLEGHGIKEVSLAGHPEGHPVVSESALREALIQKHEVATRAGLRTSLTTQFIFDTGKLFDWQRDFVETTVPGMAIDVGLPGLAKMTTLMRFAKDCGVCTSFGMLTRNFGRAFKLATAFSPEDTLSELVKRAAQCERPPFRSVHFYPFGSFERTAEWLRTTTTQLATEATN